MLLSKPKEPLPAKLVISLIYRERSAAQAGWKVIEKTWGPLDFLSEVRPFDYTSYYDKEMGRPLYRRWATFRDLVFQDRLADIKWQALDIEKQWVSDQRRQLNLDPGLITAERLVLATGKNFSHRIYLGKGIFGDLTLLFFKGSYQPLPWTYPDYRDEQSLWMFNKIREKYLREIADRRLTIDEGTV
ncbi:MAG: DUF4416 domain-containing protein [Desulfobacca sp.]|nr:DUF4416 domain-containing protein [Desulfobacca sp.]